MLTSSFSHVLLGRSVENHMLYVQYDQKKNQHHKMKSFGTCLWPYICCNIIWVLFLFKSSYRVKCQHCPFDLWLLEGENVWIVKVKLLFSPKIQNTKILIFQLQPPTSQYCNTSDCLEAVCWIEKIRFAWMTKSQRSNDLPDTGALQAIVHVWLHPALFHHVTVGQESQYVTSEWVSAPGAGVFNNASTS